MRKMPIPVVMTIAGSDSGGGAGIQADLKTFHSLGVHGTAVITCLTAQNPDRVRGIEPVTPRMVALQIRTVFEFFQIRAAKTGMLYRAPIIHAVAETLSQFRVPWLVVDPVMVSSSGARLLEKKALNTLYEELFPLAAVLTPNIPEAEAILGIKIRTLARAEEAARRIGERFRCGCILKGGHLLHAGSQCVDILYAEGRLHTFAGPAVHGVSTHGTGCTFSAALSALLARGKSLTEATARAKHFVHRTLLAPAVTRPRLK